MYVLIAVVWVLSAGATEPHVEYDHQIAPTEKACKDTVAVLKGMFDAEKTVTGYVLACDPMEGREA